MHKSAIGKTREEIIEQVKAQGESVRDFGSYIPIGSAVDKLKKWAEQGAEIFYLSALTEDKKARGDEIIGKEGLRVDQEILDRYRFPKGEVYHRKKRESYAQIAEKIAPDILIEDDCESIGGEKEMTITFINPEIKRRIQSIAIREFGGIDHLPDDLNELSNRPKETLVQFLKHEFDAAGFSRAVVAMSGGVDSSCSAALAVRALGRDNVYPLLLPYGTLTPVDDAQEVIRALGIAQTNVSHINIQPIVDPIIALDNTMDQIRRGNVMARVRMILLYDYAKRRNALVVGTENKTEHLLGYFTRFGDEASDIEPLRSLYKTQVRQLGRELGLPERIITKAPTAGLWEGQTDEGEFGFTYRQADVILSMIVDEKKPIDEVVAKGYDQATVEKVVARMKENDFKHHLPLVPVFSPSFTRYIPKK